MYKIINISTGVVVASFLTKAYATDWMVCNNFDDDGNDLHLYKVIKE